MGELAIGPGDVLHIAAQDLRYTDQDVVLRITRVRDELSRYYDGEWVWLEGTPLSADGSDGAPLQVLARTSALVGGPLS